MTVGPDNLITQPLRRIDVERLIEHVPGCEIRMTAGDEAIAGKNRRTDRLELRVERTERRLDRVDQPH